MSAIIAVDICLPVVRRLYNVIVSKLEKQSSIMARTSYLVRMAPKLTDLRRHIQQSLTAYPPKLASYKYRYNRLPRSEQSTSTHLRLWHGGFIQHVVFLQICGMYVHVCAIGSRFFLLIEYSFYYSARYDYGRHVQSSLFLDKQQKSRGFLSDSWAFLCIVVYCFYSFYKSVWDVRIFAKLGSWQIRCYIIHVDVSDQF